MMMSRDKYLMTFESKAWNSMVDSERVYYSMIPGKKYRCKDISKESKTMTTQRVAKIMKRLRIMGIVEKEEVKTGKIIEITTDTDFVPNPETGYYEEVIVPREKPLRIEETISYFVRPY